MVLKVSLNTGINRIRLEFKVCLNSFSVIPALCINRIRLEFKVAIDDDFEGGVWVLIESDWNLKIL